ncbi:hypothetical protein TeGR_g6614 [Tetraparma gracilis]|uniref:AMMECR1 domain-containing protein n=1 Tax=Tetraparma gracilis TaxID=2962635 RepID=A0ABQ6MKA5_9STRA|nr:hypothetical protein TeGR_g6614 [Tetraparma gracilis]
MSAAARLSLHCVDPLGSPPCSSKLIDPLLGTSAQPDHPAPAIGAMSALVDAPTSFTATPAMCMFAFSHLHAHLSGSPPPTLPPLPPGDAGCFVTFEARAPSPPPPSPLAPPPPAPPPPAPPPPASWQLRGCIGTLTPSPLASSLPAYALASSLGDRRFPPVALPELPLLRVGVSLLFGFCECEGPYDWQPGVHGVVVEFEAGGRGYGATFLPEIAAEQGWSVEEAIEQAVRKAGYRQPVTRALLGSMRTSRYRSSKSRVEYAEWLSASQPPP